MTIATEERQFGIAKEAVRGTAETTPAEWWPIDKSSMISAARALIEDTGLRGMPDQFPATAGAKSYEGKLKMPADAQTIGKLLMSLFGTDTVTEEATITIGATNNMIDFNIGAAELHATVASTTYKMGLAETEAGTLCKAIFDAIVAAEAVGTYHVTFSRTTMKITIARTAGTFQILWKTGVNGSDDASPTSIGPTLGYANTDDTGAVSYASDTALTSLAFTHTFTRSTTDRVGFTAFLAISATIIKKYALTTVKKLTLNGPVDNLIDVEADVLAKSEADGAIGTAAYVAPHFLSFEGVTVKIGGSSVTNVKSWKLDIDNGAAIYRTLQASASPSDIKIRGKFKVDGTLSIFFEDETERTKYLAGTANSIELIAVGPVIVGAVTEKMDIVLPVCKYKTFPFGDEGGLVGVNLTFEAFYDTVTSKTISIALTNKVAAY